MPNHIHAIIIIDTTNAAERSRPFPTLSTVIGLYKSGVSRKIANSIWQKSFYDEVIKNQEHYNEVWEYIENNPLKWTLDKYYCNFTTITQNPQQKG